MDIRTKIFAILKSLEEARAKIQAEDRLPTEEEVAEARSRLDEVDRLEKLLEDEERYNKFKERMEGRAASSGTRPNPEERGGGGQGQSEKVVYRSLGEQLLDVVNATTKNDERALGRLMEVRATGLSSQTPSDGGYLIQKDFSSELLRLTHETGILTRRCRRIPISNPSNGVKINGIDETSRADGSRWGGIRAYWADEAAAMTASRPKFKQIELSLKKLTGLLYATDELLQDAAALEAVVRTGFPEEFNFKMDDAIIRGDGAGRPLGILNSGSLISVAAEAGQEAATILYENIVKMYARCYAPSILKAEWFINQQILPQLFTMALVIGTGGSPVYLPPNGAAGAPYGSLLGRPVQPIEQCAALGTVGDIIFGDLSQYMLAEKGGLQTDASIHVQFLYNETVFRFILRVDGQPIWHTTLTPYAGDTLSPFVALATRA